MDGTDELVGLFPPGTRQVGSEILRAEELAAAVAPLAAVGQYPVYDLGGGLGPRYTYNDDPPRLDEYLDALIGAAREHLPAGARILIEPGEAWWPPTPSPSAPSPPSSQVRPRSLRWTAGWRTTSR
jgi:Pyridoxal-dependent decarboxylase, pyridoxal binding domain